MKHIVLASITTRPRYRGGLSLRGRPRDVQQIFEDAHHAIDGNGQSVAHHIATEAGMERNREPGDKAERASELYRLYRGDRSAGDQTEPCSGESGQ